MSSFVVMAKAILGHCLSAQKRPNASDGRVLEEVWPAVSEIHGIKSQPFPFVEGHAQGGLSLKQKATAAGKE
jgi:hypothetical protein